MGGRRVPQVRIGPAVLGEGMAPIYFVTIPAWTSPATSSEQRRSAARPPPPDSTSALGSRLAARLSKMKTSAPGSTGLERSLHTRLSTAPADCRCPGQPAGPQSPLCRPRDRDAQSCTRPPGSVSSASSARSTASAGWARRPWPSSTAFAYADFYPGGRWLVACGGMSRAGSRDPALKPGLGGGGGGGGAAAAGGGRRRERLGERRATRPRSRTPLRWGCLIQDHIKQTRCRARPGRRAFRPPWLHVLATHAAGSPGGLSPDDVRHLLAVDESARGRRLAVHRALPAPEPVRQRRPTDCGARSRPC